MPHTRLQNLQISNRFDSSFAEGSEITVAEGSEVHFKGGELAKLPKIKLSPTASFTVEGNANVQIKEPLSMDQSSTVNFANPKTTIRGDVACMGKVNVTKGSVLEIETSTINISATVVTWERISAHKKYNIMS